MKQLIFDFFKTKKQKPLPQKKAPLNKFDIKEYIKKGKLYVLDFGAKRATLYDGNPEETVDTISLNDVLSLPENLPPGSVLVCESAHLGSERKGLSRAQIYSQDQLQAIYKNCEKRGITLKLYPQRMTPRACVNLQCSKNEKNGKGFKLDRDNNRNEDLYEKSDETDPVAIHRYLGVSDIQLRNPKPPKTESEQKLDKYVEALRRELSEHLNYQRGHFPHQYFDPEDYCLKFALKFLDHTEEDLSMESREYFGFKRYKKKTDIKCEYLAEIFGKQFFEKGDLNLRGMKLQGIFSILNAFIISDTGKLRFRNNALFSWRFFNRKILQPSAFRSQNCGVLRSNIYHHGVRTYTRSIENILSKKKCGKKLETKEKQAIDFPFHQNLESNFDFSKIKMQGKMIGEFTSDEEKVRKEIKNYCINRYKELFNVVKKCIEDTGFNEDLLY